MRTRGLASRLMGDAFEVVDPRKFLRYARTYPGVLPVLHLDHFYYDRQLSLRSFRLDRSRKALVASDHLPMVAEPDRKSVFSGSKVASARSGNATEIFVPLLFASTFIWPLKCRTRSLIPVIPTPARRV
jgi:hypothetical protein